MHNPKISLKITSLIHKETENKAAIVSVKIIIPFRWSFNWFYELFQNPIKTRKYLSVNGITYRKPFIFKSYNSFIQGIESFQKRFQTYYPELDFELDEKIKNQIEQIFYENK